MDITANKPREQDLLPRLRLLLERSLPPEWDFELETERRVRDRLIDGDLLITAPDGNTARLAIEAKQSLYPRDAYALSSQLGGLWPANNRRPSGRAAEIPGYDGVMAVTSFLTPRTREMLKEVGFSYADATGNLRISTRRPAIYIEVSGSADNPWLERRELRTLKGPASASVVRALLDFQPPYKLRDLADKSSLALATASRVVNLLEKDGLVIRDERGSIEAANVRTLIQRWIEDYSMLDAASSAFFLDPRGPEVAFARLGTFAGRYAVTGSFAAIRRAPIATPSLLAAYVTDVTKAARALDLRPAPGGGNVVLLGADSSLAFTRTWSEEGVTYAALSQVVADLLTSPGRGPSEGEALLEWMEANESAWRRD